MRLCEREERDEMEQAKVRREREPRMRSNKERARVMAEITEAQERTWMAR